VRLPDVEGRLEVQCPDYKSLHLASGFGCTRNPNWDRQAIGGSSISVCKNATGTIYYSRDRFILE